MPATMVDLWRRVPDLSLARRTGREDGFDVIVRGEGEATIVALVEALERRQSAVRRRQASPSATICADPLPRRPARTIADLDAYRVGWELIDHRRYSYWGGKRAVVMQFSRGCPHLCNYCGQRGFWTRWRHRDPVKFASEIARLHREHGVELINLADENPTVVQEGLARLSRRA